MVESDTSGSSTTDPRRAARAASVLGLLAVASLAGGWLIPGHRFEPLEMLPAIVGMQVVGAIAVTAWLAWRRPPARR